MLNHKHLMLLLVTVLLCLSVSCASQANNPDISNGLRIIEDNSFFVDFSVKDNKVYIDCDIEVENNLDSDLSFYLIGDFNEDEGKLLKERSIYAVDKETTSKVFTLKPSEKKCFEVVLLIA